MHNKIRECDEYFCTVCGKRWDVSEDEPPCITPARARRENSLRHVKKLRKEFKR